MSGLPDLFIFTGNIATQFANQWTFCLLLVFVRLFTPIVNRR